MLRYKVSCNGRNNGCPEGLPRLLVPHFGKKLSSLAKLLSKGADVVRDGMLIWPLLIPFTTAGWLVFACRHRTAISETPKWP